MQPTEFCASTSLVRYRLRDLISVRIFPTRHSPNISDPSNRHPQPARVYHMASKSEQLHFRLRTSRFLSRPPEPHFRFPNTTAHCQLSNPIPTRPHPRFLILVTSVTEVRASAVKSGLGFRFPCAPPGYRPPWMGLGARPLLL